MANSIQRTQMKQEGINEAIKHLLSINQKVNQRGTEWKPTFTEVIDELKKYSDSIGYVPVSKKNN